MLRALAYRLVAVLLGTTMAFGVAEVALRLFSPQRTGPAELAYDSRVGSIPIPSHQGRINLPGVYQYSFRNEDDGTRATGIVDRQQAAARILILGDSFTYGIGVNNEETFAYLLEKALAADGLSAAVINAGNPGKGTDYALRFFETIGRDYRPAVTVLAFFPTDFRDNKRTRIYRVGSDGTLSVKPTLGALYFRKRALSGSALYNWFMSWSHVGNLVRQAAINVIRSQPEGEDSDLVVTYGEDRGRFLDEPGKALTRIFIERLITTVSDAGSHLIILYIPRASQVESYRATGEVSEEEQALEEILARTAVRATSLTPVLAGSPEPLERLYFDERRSGHPGGHWTPRAHAIAAEVLTPMVKARLAERTTRY